MLILKVCRKNLISALRGEYVDFLISRFTFTVFTMATALVLFRLRGGQVAPIFLDSAGGVGYPGFMVVGTALYGTTHGILLNVSRTLMTERREGTLESVLMIPFPRWQYYGGAQLYQFVITGFDVLLAVIIGKIIGLRFDVHPAALIAAAVQFFLTLYGIALLVSLLMIKLKDTYFIQNTIIPLVLLIGGYLFPVEVLPPPLRIAADIFPVHRGVEMIRSAVLRGSWNVSASDYAFSLFPGLLFLILGYLLLPYIERKALEEYLS